jgi:hypothetical protein
MHYLLNKYCIALGMASFLSFLGSSSTCRIAVWTSAFGLAVSSICTTTCLLMKAYMVQMRDKRILFIGAAFTPLASINI